MVEANESQSSAHEDETAPHLTPSHEDYVEALVILEQSKHSEEIRSVDVANLMNVSKASVNKALTLLRDAGFIEQERYGRVRLTESGREYGMQVWGRHQTLRRFLIDDLGVEPDIANEEACRMEHVVTQETVDKLEAYLRREHGGAKEDQESEQARAAAIESGVTVKFDM